MADAAGPGHPGLKTDTGQTQGGRMADKVWKRGKRTQAGHKARGGHMAGTRRTSSGDAARAYRGQPFFLRENPTANCLGKK